MKAIRVALLTSALLVGSAIPAFAAEAAPTQMNPAQTCGTENAVPTPFGPLPVPSRGGCASSIATGELSKAAYVAQCQDIRETDPVSFYATPENPGPFGYGFGGTIGSCAKILEAFHTAPH
ncbi:MAG: hypothetical protein M3Q65_22200 [Chloroflexota bacterium]|nr:hypothetical protein [Chloroflexota bacterium]